MSVSNLFTAPRGESAFDLGAASASVGASQRADLGRGLVFVLLLALSALASVYLPLALNALGGPDWVEGTAQAPRPAAP